MRTEFDAKKYEWSDAKKYEWTAVHAAASFTRAELEESLSVRIPDPWWRRPLVWLRILKPRYRRTTVSDELARRSAQNVRGIPNRVQR